jgi:hypothetical protein
MKGLLKHGQQQLQLGRAQIQQACQPAGIEGLALAMGQQTPQPLHQGQGQPQLKRSNIPPQEGADEVLAPIQAGLIVTGQQTVGKAAAQPQLLPCAAGVHFLQQKGREFHLGDAAGQAFVALPQCRGPNSRAAGDRVRALMRPAWAYLGK